MAIAAVICAGDMAKLPHLAAAERAIRNGHAQHIGMQLQIKAVLQPQRLELVLGQFTGETARHLVAELIDAGIDDRLVILVVTVHFRSEEHTSELQSLMRISYAVFCLKKKKQ